jgi:hypothetical protein
MGGVVNTMDTTQLGLYLEVQIFPSCAPMVVLDFQAMELVV